MFQHLEWVESGLHLPAFQNKTGQITASVNKCWMNSAVLWHWSMNFLHSVSMGFSLWIALDRIWCVYLIIFWQDQHSPVHFLHWWFWPRGWTHSIPWLLVLPSPCSCCSTKVTFLYSWQGIPEMGRKPMFSLYQPFLVMWVVNDSVSLAKQQALGLLQPCWRVKCGSLLAFLHCQAGPVIIYCQSCCWQKKWCLFAI